MKKNIRKIPKDVISKLKLIESEDIVAACTVRYRAVDLGADKLSHLGIELTEQGLTVPASIIPPFERGKYSRINVQGELVVRKDLGLQTHYRTVETPNWGDSSKGYHDVDLPYQAYPKEFRSPRETDVFIHAASKAPGLHEYVISFRVNDVLRKKSRDFKQRLLEDLNLLQENVGTCGIEASETPLEDYAKSLHLSWEILPPGTKEEALQRLFHGRQTSPKSVEVASDRYEFFMTLNPEKLVYGTSGFRRYFGALVSNDLVVFENIEYGNAIYIMFEDWQELSKRSRIELLTGTYGDSFVRIPHIKGWKTEAREIIKSKLGRH